MKKKVILLLLFGIIIYHGCFGQPYKSVFGHDTTQWNVIYQIPDYFPTIIYRTYNIDTLINGLDYKLLYQVYVGNHWYDDNKYGFLREDTIEGKLWFMSLDYHERLIMDLSINKEDTFAFGTSINDKLTVDTVFYKSGKKYILFYEEGSPDTISFTEGIGPSNFMFFAEEEDHPTLSQIRCMYTDNNLVYKNYEYSGCLDTITGIMNNKIQEIKLYPNPTTDFITIQNDEEKQFKIELFSNMGSSILRINIKGKDHIDISYLPSGIYIIRVSTKSEFLITKLIKF
jgi:hypothetical protein